MSTDEYQHRIESATRMVRENGVTYNVYDEASGLGRLWKYFPACLLVLGHRHPPMHRIGCRQQQHDSKIHVRH